MSLYFSSLILENRQTRGMKEEVKRARADTPQMQGQGQHGQQGLHTGYPVPGTGSAGYYPAPPPQYHPAPHAPPPQYQHAAPPPAYGQQPPAQQASGSHTLLNAAATVGVALLGAASAATTASRGGGGTRTAAPAVVQMHAVQMQHAGPAGQPQNILQQVFSQGVQPSPPGGAFDVDTFARLHASTTPSLILLGFLGQL